MFIADYYILSNFVYKLQVMSLSKTSGNQTVSKRAKQLRSAGLSSTRASTNVIVVTVDPEIDKLVSVEKVTPKTEMSKEMFANYRKGL